MKNTTLIDVRKSFKLTQKQLALLLKMGCRTIQRWESDENNVPEYAKPALTKDNIEKLMNKEVK